MSAIASYRELLRIVGPAYVVVAFLGRIPLAMSQLGTLLLVSSATGSYGRGGAAAGALAIANAVGSPLAGNLADRIGQRPVVLVQSLSGATGLVLVVVAVQEGRPFAEVLAAAILTGFVLPQVGPLARVRWAPITAEAEVDEVVQRRLVDAAFSYEGAADEASFVLGPALIGVLVIVVDPAGALLVAASLLAVFGTWFAVHPTAALAAASASGGPGPIARLWTGAFVVLVVAQFLVGGLFGSIQTGTTALATAAGQPGAAGLLHALLGVGSVVAGLAMSAVPEHILYSTRMLGSATALLAFSLPLLWVDSIGSLVVVIAILGFAVAPYMISNFALAGIIVPLHRVGAAMTFLAAATGLGYAVGAGIAGRLADTLDQAHHGAFMVTVVATWLAVVLALAANRTLRHAPTNVA